MEKENEKSFALSIVELIISIIGFTTFFIMFVIVNTKQRIIFLLAAIFYAFNIVDTCKEIKEEKRKMKIRKYSMRTVDAKSKEKLSY